MTTRICKRKVVLLAVFFMFAAYQSLSPRSATTAPAAQTEPPMYVLQVGIGRYADGKTWPSLTGSINDVMEMRKLLIGGRYNVKEENIHTLVDANATKKRIIDEFSNHLIKNARDRYTSSHRRDTVVLFQFSGHGSQVPDTNGDEDDNLDESIVPYDSKDEPGNNFDITDDEIFELTAQLERYTDNIVFVLDSCHSGSGTRDSEESRRLPARRTAPTPMVPIQSSGSDQKQKDNRQTDLLPPGDDYIVISAAAANQLAGQVHHFADSNSKVPITFGYLTFFLIDELRNAKHDTTYRELMENVAFKVTARKPSQVPQLEGDSHRFVFGGLGSREDCFVRILEKGTNTVTIEAGTMQGVTSGTIISIYGSSVADLRKAEKIGTAKVVEVQPDRAIAKIVNRTRELTVKDKAAILSPDLGSARLKVNLDLDETRLTPNEKSVYDLIRKRFFAQTSGAVDVSGVEIVAKTFQRTRPADWDVALLKDEFGRVFPRASTTANEKTASARPVFYLAGPDFVPLFGFYVETARTDAAAAIETALIQMARLRAVRAIANHRSPLAEKVKVVPERFRLPEPACDADGKIITLDRTVASPNAAKTGYLFDQKEFFWLAIENTTKADLFITVLEVGTDGSVKILVPRKIAGERDEGLKIAAGRKRIVLGDSCRDGALRTTGPAGLQTFKIIASTLPTRRQWFEFLEMEGMARGEPPSLTAFGDWISVDVNFEISTTQRP